MKEKIFYAFIIRESGESCIFDRNRMNERKIFGFQFYSLCKIYYSSTRYNEILSSKRINGRTMLSFFTYVKDLSEPSKDKSGLLSSLL